MLDRANSDRQADRRSALSHRGLFNSARLHAAGAGLRVRETHRLVPKGFLWNKNNRLMGISNNPYHFWLFSALFKQYNYI